MADGGSERADGRIVKMEVDYSATVDQRLPECAKLAKGVRLLQYSGWIREFRSVAVSQSIYVVKSFMDHSYVPGLWPGEGVGK
ncbi:hypothetical protein H8959_019356 [Pygathrix nigripes]